MDTHAAEPDPDTVRLYARVLYTFRTTGMDLTPDQLMDTAVDAVVQAYQIVTDQNQTGTSEEVPSVQDGPGV